MIVEIKFNCDTVAFDQRLRAEISRILEDAVHKVMFQLDRPHALCTEPEWADVLRDINGNKIGTVEVME